MGQYQELGIDPHKDLVKQIFGGLIKKAFPYAFVNTVRDRNNPNRIIVKHADGSGSKTITRILYYLVTGNPDYLKGDPYDSLVMNTGDVAAAGFVFQPYELTDIIEVSPLDIKKQIYLEQVALGIAELFTLYRSYGFELDFFGGETADLPDQTFSAILNMDIRTWAYEEDVIRGETQPGDVLFDFCSDGQATWENVPNSGIMSNGQTMGRKKTQHRKYSYLFSHLCNPKKPFEGIREIDQFIPELGMTIGEGLISNTRQWPIVIRRLIEILKEKEAFHLLHGISMNTGGGLSKCGNLGRGVRYELSIPEPPPIFQIIKRDSREEWPGMLTAFNNGVGLTIVGSPEGGILEKAISLVSGETRIQWLSLGECSKSKRSDGANEVFVKTPNGVFGDLLLAD